MRPEKVFKRYDIRGKHPEEIDGEFAEILGKSFASFLRSRGEDCVVVSRDTKNTSEELQKRLMEGLMDSGIRCLDAGAGPTDYTALSAVENGVYGVQVTSSHLPLNYNGFKFIYPEGNGLMNPDLDEIRELFRNRDFVNADRSEPRDISSKMHQIYLDKAEEYVRETAGAIQGDVQVESMSGAGSVFLPKLLESLGADVQALENRIDPPNPTREQLKHLEGLAVATDMDGDRVAFRDGQGWLDGNEIALALAEYLEPDQLVASIDTSKVVESSIPGEVKYTRVGDPFVISQTIESRAELAVEPNGHYCFPEFVPYNSGTVAAALLLATGASRKDLPDFHQLRESYRTDNPEKTVQNVKDTVKTVYSIMSERDGVQYETENARVLVRPSGTSPKVRVVVDSDGREMAEDALAEVAEIIQNG